MKERMIEMTCPFCGHVFHIKRDTLAIQGISSNVEERLEDGTYFRHRCSQCHQLFTMVYPFLFRFPNRKISLVLSWQQTIKGFDRDEKVIHCQNIESFLFSYKVISQNLDLGFMVKQRNKWIQRWGKDISFEKYDQTHHCLWINVHGDWKAIQLSKEEENELTTVV